MHITNALAYANYKLFACVYPHYYFILNL